MSNKGGRVSPDYLADIAPEYALFLSDVPFNMFLFTVSHPCVGGYFGWLGLLIVREELYLECNCFYFHMY